ASTSSRSGTGRLRGRTCTRRRTVRANCELEDVRPAVVAHRVEALPLGQQPPRVEVRVENSLFVVQRPGEVGTVGSEDRAAAVADRSNPLDLGGEREVVGVRRLALERGRRDDVRTALARDVDKRLLPGVAVVGSRGDVDLDTRLVERNARERHVVLPADQAADTSESGLDGLEAATVALTPDQALVVGGHELAVVKSELAGRRVVEKR